MSERHIPWKPWIPALAYMALIWVLSSLPTIASLEQVPFKDKGVHFVEYGTLAVLLCYAIRGTWPLRSLWFTAFYGFVGTVLWGMLDEIHQAYVPGRSSDPMDVLADTIGAALATTLSIVVLQMRNRRRGLASSTQASES